MKTTLLIIASFFISMTVLSQSKIHGVVLDNRNEPVVGANIYLKDTYDGATSSVDGSFSFETEESGKFTLTISFIGFKTYESEIELPIADRKIDVKLIESINKIDGVVISAGTFEASDERKAVQLKPLDVVTTAGALGDVVGALQTLPGATTVGESGRLFVRGGESRETQTFIDGIMVQNPYNSTIPNLPTRGRYSPLLFKGTSFSTGGYSAEYGQALSSALVLSSKDMPTQDKTDISVMAVGADISQVKKFENSALIGKVEYTNLAPLFSVVHQDVQWEKEPETISGMLSYRQKISENGLLKLYSNYGHSKFSLFRTEVGEAAQSLIELINDNAYLNVSYSDILNKKWSMKTGVSYGYNKDKVQLGADNLTEINQGSHIKTAMFYDASERVSVKFGAELLHQNFDELFEESATFEEFSTAFKENIYSAFGEADLFASNRLVFRAGARLEHSTLLGETQLSPRASMAFKASDESQFSFAYGRFYQLPSNGDFRFTQDLEFERAHHYILNYQIMKNERTFRAEAYYKDYDRLVKFDSQNPFDIAKIDNSGYGYARGIDLWWRDRKSIKNADFWISYSLLDTERNYRGYPESATPSFAAKHNIAVVYKHFVADLKSQIGFAYKVASGRPYDNPNTDGFNNEKTKTYNTLNLNWSYLHRSNIIIHGEVSNVLGTNNIFGYEYAASPDNNGVFAERAVMPPAPRFIFVGLFITLSKDNKANQIDSL